jgi:hypothetical protein
LAPGHFCRGDPDFEAWISLDFLGFSRPNRDFSMGYADEAGNVFRSPFSALVEAMEREHAVWTCGRAGLFMGQA